MNKMAVDDAAGVDAVAPTAGSCISVRWCPRMQMRHDVCSRR